MDAKLRKKVEANLFPFARPAVEPWDAFPWHPNSKDCMTWQANSSQALAIDVFGTLKCLPQNDRDVVCDALAVRLGLPTGGPWTLELEWNDPANLLQETGQPTQVDAIAVSPHTMIFFEGKFSERDGGPCSQPNYKHQCNSNYEPQQNPVNTMKARCALAAKGIRYWEIIPAVLRFDADQDYKPCPFAGPWYQWMRNLVLSYEVAKSRTLQPGFVVAYAEGPGLHMAEQIRSERWSDFVKVLRPEVVKFTALSYQTLIQEAASATQAAGLSTQLWQELDEWVQGKVQRVSRS